MGDFDRIALVEQEDRLAVDLSHEELVRGGDRQYREVDEQEFTCLVEAVEPLGDPRGRRPSHLVGQLDRRQTGQGLLDDLEGRWHRVIVDDDVQVDVGPFVDSIERGGSGFPERVDVRKGFEGLGHGLNDQIPGYFPPASHTTPTGWLSRR